MKSFIAVALCVLLIFGMYWISPRRPKDIPVVEVVMPEICDITDSVSIRGEVMELSREPLFADSLSVVEGVYVKVGQQVKKGDALMKLRPTVDPQAVSAARYADLELAAQAISESDPAEWQNVLSAMAESQYSPDEPAEPQAYTLYSPINGTVMSVSAMTGESVSSVFPCVVVSNLKELYVRAYADETSIKKLKEGQKCMVYVSALTEREVSGVVSSISPEASQTTSLISGSQIRTEVTIKLTGKNSDLRPGYSASVRVVTDRCEDAVLVPFNAIGQDKTGREYVMTWREGKACKQIIKTRYELEAQADVISGVGKNDILILDPDQLKDGQEVQAFAGD